MRPPRLLAVVVATFVLAFAVACGSDDDSNGGSTGAATGSTGGGSTAAASPTSDTETAAFPVTIEHQYGSTTIESEPLRVVSLGFVEQDALFALGVEPIAARFWVGDESSVIFPWAEEAAGDADPEVLNMVFGELDYEKIAAVNPDLISAVYAGITQEEYDTLSRIAPTLAQSDEYIEFGMPWQEGTVVIGRAVGQEERAVELVEELQAKYDAIREAHPEWGDMTFAIVSPGGQGQAAIFGSGDLRSRAFIDLGFTLPDEFDEITGESFYANVSIERAELFNQDLVIIHQLAYYEGGQAALEADPIWNSLSAFQEGRLIFLEHELDLAFGFNSVLSMGYFLDSMVSRIEAAVDGDPATAAN